ncbi:bifunctional 2-polyprenyl-6-hydroxyphenol methylase/3-demethylubiquinol 3-O-methyltransferase UbiG [Vitiosangium sp. GDMCC 1.1324]|uniref:class I SAM-dependent methyltransferase n=1 Tax=Vitiosangium sp. (strain GDMCC 1.1324) TaxID=2138576 RepID=UPI000D3628AA|nr:class I SAM-dependent methyltransferase [Vitiosangium sp. GDMCC 1.1324]PTL83646.1 class I SAM-dependent methyltransferase [Vitiosangium sp. GDMCC 1.1324]
MAGNDTRGRTPLSLVGQEPDLLFYTRQATEHGGPVLVLGAANGRVVWALAEAGVSVLGVDPSERMVQAAEELRASEPAEVSGRVRFLHADPRSLRLTERFQVVLAPQHALGMMGSREDLEAFLATVRHHLEPGGLFAYDVLNPPAEPASHRNADEEEPGAALEPRRPVFAFHLRERRQPGAPLGIRRLRLRPFSPEELDEAMKACGLTPRERYGRFDGKPFDPEDPRHIGVVEG